MIVVAYLGSECTKFHIARWWCWVFMSFYLGIMHLAHCDFAMGPTKVQHNILCKSRKKCNGYPGKDYTSVQGRKHEPYMKGPNSPRPKDARQVRSKVKSMLIIFVDIKRIVHKEFVLTGQTVNSIYYWDILRLLREYVRRLRPELWRQKNWLFHYDKAPTHTSFFTRIFFTRNITTVTLHFSVSPIEDKAQRLPFWHNWGDWSRIGGNS
jgi:hypothetical protein